MSTSAAPAAAAVATKLNAATARDSRARRVAILRGESFLANFFPMSGQSGPVVYVYGPATVSVVSLHK
jgi:hypothetical protein